jgi:hypothetical protein
MSRKISGNGKIRTCGTCRGVCGTCGEIGGLPLLVSLGTARRVKKWSKEINRKRRRSEMAAVFVYGPIIGDAGS